MKSNDSEILARIEAQIAALDKKVDALMNSIQKPMMERSSFSDKGFGGKGSNKMTYKAVCAECGQTCGVPFKPAGDRPVFCSECFARHQGDASSESKFHKKPRDFRKPAGVRKPFFKKTGKY